MADQINPIASFIENLEKLNESKTVDDKLPFSKIKYRLRPLNASQVSKINSSLVASNNFNSQIIFNELTKNLFDELVVLEEGKTYKSFNILDYMYLVFKIRGMVDDKIKVSNDEGETIGTTSVKERLTEYKKQKMEKELEYGEKACKITLYLPSYQRVIKFNSEMEKVYKAISKKKDPDLEEFFKYTFKSYISLFIKTVKIVVDGEETEVDFHTINKVDDQISIMNHIPNTVFKDIYKKIQRMMKPSEDLVKYDDDNNIDLDVGFYIKDI